MKVNAVFEGGGVKAIGLVGGVKAAEQFNIEFHDLAGTSSGAIVSAFIAAGYRADEMKKLIMSMPFSSFTKKDMLLRIKGIGPALRIFLKKGLYSGAPLERWVWESLKKKGIETFGDLRPGQLRIIASDITRGRMIVLPDDIAEYGIEPNELKISVAIMMSAALPYFFEPVVLKNDDKRCYIVDGGLLSNFPLWLFDRKTYSQNKLTPTIGFHLVGRNQTQPNKIFGPVSMFRALFSTMMEAHDERYIEKHARYRTIKIQTLGIRSTQFDLSPREASNLYASGLEAGRTFFEKWSMADYLNQFETTVAKSLSAIPPHYC